MHNPNVKISNKDSKFPRVCLRKQSNLRYQAVNSDHVHFLSGLLNFTIFRLKFAFNKHQHKSH